MCFSLYKGLDEDWSWKRGIAKELENYEEIVSELVKKQNSQQNKINNHGK
jgi:choline/glycine/proline betaine transport protein